MKDPSIFMYYWYFCKQGDDSGSAIDDWFNRSIVQIPGQKALNTLKAGEERDEQLSYITQNYWYCDYPVVAWLEGPKGDPKGEMRTFHCGVYNPIPNTQNPPRDGYDWRYCRNYHFCGRIFVEGICSVIEPGRLFRNTSPEEFKSQGGYTSVMHGTGIYSNPERQEQALHTFSDHWKINGRPVQHVNVRDFGEGIFRDYPGAVLQPSSWG